MAVGTVGFVVSASRADGGEPFDELPLRVPGPGELLHCIARVGLDSVSADVMATEDRITVEYWRVDDSTGRRMVYIVRQYSRHDPALRAELARLRLAS